MAAAGRKLKVASLLPCLVKSLRKESLNPVNQIPRRMFSLYDQINLIDNVPDEELRFKGYSDTGFTINDTKYEGSLLIVENKVLSWAPKRLSDISSESLSIFKILRPVPDSKNHMGSRECPVHHIVQMETWIQGAGIGVSDRLHSDCLFFQFSDVDSFTSSFGFQIGYIQIEILVLGCGRHIEPITPELRQFIRSTGMKLEVVDSRNAASTFNILSEEGRMVAAALLPYGVYS